MYHTLHTVHTRMVNGPAKQQKLLLLFYAQHLYSPPNKSR